MTYFVNWNSPEIEESFGLAIADAYIGKEWHSEDLNLPAEFEDIHLDMVEEVSDIDVVDVRRLTDSMYLMSVEAHLACNFNVSIFKPDYFLFEDYPGLSVTDFDWNKRYLLATVSVSMLSDISLALDTSDSRRRKIEILWVKPIISEDERLEASSRRRYKP